jgi:hypothetical protein
MALLRLSTPAVEERQKEGFVAAEVLVEAAMDGGARRETAPQADVGT